MYALSITQLRRRWIEEVRGLPGETEPRKTSYPEYISAQMEAARRAGTPEHRSRCLASAIAANGLWLRAQEIGFIPEELPMSVISRTADAIEDSRAFQELLADETGRELAKNGNLREIIDRLTDKAEELKIPILDQAGLNALIEKGPAKL